MVARGLAPPSFSVAGGSALTKSCRPVDSETFAIWALARGAKKLAQRNSVPRKDRAAIAVRFTIVPRGRQTPFFCNQIQSVQFSTSPGRGQCLFRTRSPCQTVYPLGRTPGEWFVLRSRAGREVGSVRAALDTTRLGSRACV